MSDREERSKRTQRPHQYGYVHEWLWRMAPRLAPEWTYALRVASRAFGSVLPILRPLGDVRGGPS